MSHLVHLGEGGTGGGGGGAKAWTWPCESEVAGKTEAGPGTREPSGEGRRSRPGGQALESGPDVPAVGSGGLRLSGLGLGLLEKELLLQLANSQRFLFYLKSGRGPEPGGHEGVQLFELEELAVLQLPVKRTSHPSS